MVGASLLSRCAGSNSIQSALASVRGAFLRSAPCNDYFEDGPRDALDFTLWMESDRMKYLRGAITQAKLDEPRGDEEENRPSGFHPSCGESSRCSD
jgi:hypothetical protein